MQVYKSSSYNKTKNAFIILVFFKVENWLQKKKHEVLSSRIAKQALFSNLLLLCYWFEMGLLKMLPRLPEQLQMDLSKGLLEKQTNKQNPSLPIMKI